MADNGNYGSRWSSGVSSNGFGSNGREPDSVLFTNVRVLDGSGDYPFTGEVLVQGNRIRQITRGGSRFGSSSGGVATIDGMGATLMPGMVDAHLHLSWNNAPGVDPIQKMPVEEHMLWTVEMAKLVLDAGFTAGKGAAAAKPRLDVVIRDAINAGRVPGPRYTAAGPEITTIGGLGDFTLPHMPHEGLNLGMMVNGPEDVRRVVRTLIKYGVDTIKLNLSGEEITGMAAEETPMSEEEIAMAVKEARMRNKSLAAHARSSESVRQCIRHGIEAIYHASFCDEETLDMLEAAKDRHFVAPGLAWLVGTARHAGECATAAAELEREIRSYGGEPSSGGTVAGALHRGWVSVKAAFTALLVSLASASSMVASALSSWLLNTDCAAAMRLAGSGDSSVKPPSAASTVRRRRLLRRTAAALSGSLSTAAPEVASMILPSTPVTKTFLLSGSADSRPSCSALMMA